MTDNKRNEMMGEMTILTGSISYFSNILRKATSNESRTALVQKIAPMVERRLEIGRLLNLTPAQMVA